VNTERGREGERERERERERRIMRKLKGMHGECVPERWKEECNAMLTGQIRRYNRCED